MKLKLWTILVVLFLVSCAPATPAVSGDGIVRAVLFYTPGCSSCEKILHDVIPPLQTRFGSRFQLQTVPLNDLSEVDRLFAAASYFKLAKDDIQTPLVVIGSDVLSGEAAVTANLETKIKAGIVAGGYPQPNLPTALAELAARPTPTPRATLPSLNGGLNVPTKAADPGSCVINTPCPTAAK